MSYIFISYSRYDEAYVKNLASVLEQRGLKAWYDAGIEAGDRWWRTIEDAIEKCAVFMVIMSPEARESEWVEREILLAQRDKKPIIPLLLRGREFGMLINVQSFNVTDGSLPDERVYEILSRHLPQSGEPPRRETEKSAETIMPPASPSMMQSQQQSINTQPDAPRNPDALLYSKQHVWVELNNHFATIGITDYGQKSLSTVVHIVLPAINIYIKSGEVFASIETDKVASDLDSPISGTVIEVNSILINQPDLINTDPYGGGWLANLKTRFSSLNIDTGYLMDAAQYAAYCKTL